MSYMDFFFFYNTMKILQQDADVLKILHPFCLLFFLMKLRKFALWDVISQLIYSAQIKCHSKSRVVR